MTQIKKTNIRLKKPSQKVRATLYTKSSEKSPSRTIRNLKKYLFYGSIFLALTYFYFSGEELDPVAKKVNEITYYKPKYDDTFTLEEKMQDLGLLKRQTVSSENLTKYQTYVFEEHRNNVNSSWGRYWVANKFESYCSQLAHRAYPDGEFEKAIIVDCISEMVLSTFPEYHKDILSIFSKMHTLNSWMKQKAGTKEWKSLSQKERQRLLWEKRYDVLGVDTAEEIYRKDLDFKLSNSAVIVAAQTKGATFEEKLEEIDKGLNDFFGDKKAQTYKKNERYRLTKKFLKLDSVQKDLASMPPDRRKEALHTMREKMGFTEEEIARLEKMDNKNEEEWTKGKDYMARREQVKKQYKKNEVAVELQKLREEIFGKESAIDIRNEETRGHFRYQGKFKYGLQ